jgi:hypothetical protein
MASQQAGSDRYLGLNGVVESVINDRKQTFEELDLLTKLYTGKEHYYGDIEPVENEAKANYVVLVIRPERFYTFG